MGEDRRPTLATVAARAAVSRQTVSNALNLPHLVRPQTLERVLAVVAEVGYRPHGAARQLRTRRSGVIGLRLEPTADGLGGAVLDRFLHAVTEQAQRRGYRVMLFTAADDDAEIGQYSELADVFGVDAFVLTSTRQGDPRTRWLRGNDLPFVTFGRPWGPPGVGRADRVDDVTDHAWVDVDGAVGTRAATEHLLGLGHRRIAFIGWPRGSDGGDDRRSGWARAMRAAGRDDDDLRALSIGVVDGVGTGAAAAERLLAGAPGPSAFVCASDSLALGALSTARAVPVAAHGGRPAVVGFDDSPVARAVGLSSVALPLTEAAGRALDLLLVQVAERSGPGTDRADRPGTAVLLEPRLVVRDSSAHRHPSP